MSSSKEPDTGNESRKKKKGFVGGLKTEWNLFWETILGEDQNSKEEDSPKTKDPFVTGKLETLSVEQIKAITKALSSDRRKLNQGLEALAKEIDENTARLESLKLVGGETEETLQSLHELTDLGQKFSEQLSRIDERIKQARQVEDQLRRSR